MQVQAQPLDGLGASRPARVVRHEVHDEVQLLQYLEVVAVQVHPDLRGARVLALGERVGLARLGEPLLHVLAGALADVPRRAVSVGRDLLAVPPHEVGRQHLQQAAIGIGVAAVRRGRQQEQVGAGAGGDVPHDLPAVHVRLAPAVAVGHGRVVGLVYNDDVPLALEDFGLDPRVLGVVDGDDQLVKVQPRVGSRRDGPLQPLARLRTHHLELLVEQVAHLLPPLLAQARRGEDQH